MKQNKASRAPSQRQLRVGEVIRHALAEILQRGEVHDPVFEGSVITVPEVRMAADLKCATVYLMPLGGQNKEEVVAAFDRNKKYIRGEVARRVNLRSAPDLRFRLDTSFDEGAKIDAVLRSDDVKRDLNGNHAVVAPVADNSNEPSVDGGVNGETDADNGAANGDLNKG